MLEYHVHAALNDLLHFLGDLLLVVIDGVVGAQLLCELEFVLVTRGGNDRTAQHFADLDGSRTDAGARSEHQDGLSVMDASAGDEHMPGGEEDEWDAGGLVEAEGVGNRDYFGTRHDNEFAIASLDELSADSELAAEAVLAALAELAAIAGTHGCKEYPLAFPEIGYVFANARDNAADVAAEDQRQLNAGNALADPEVEVVEGAGFHLDKHLVLTQLGFGDVFVLEDLGTAEFMNANRFHCALLANGKLYHVKTGSGSEVVTPVIALGRVCIQ